VYGPVRTVVWQGSVGDRRPYAVLTPFRALRADCWGMGCFRQLSKTSAPVCAGNPRFPSATRHASVASLVSRTAQGKTFRFDGCCRDFIELDARGSTEKPVCPVGAWRSRHIAYNSETR
jgi:hypothetical protein